MRKVVVFSGHREVGDGHTALIQQATVRAVEDADEFVFGGAAGADLIAFKAAWQARMAARQACQLSEDQYTAIIQKRPVTRRRTGRNVAVLTGSGRRGSSLGIC